MCGGVCVCVRVYAENGAEIQWMRGALVHHDRSFAPCSPVHVQCAFLGPSPSTALVVLSICAYNISCCLLPLLYAIICTKSITGTTGYQRTKGICTCECVCALRTGVISRDDNYVNCPDQKYGIHAAEQTSIAHLLCI